MVVITIIAILAAMLLPSLFNAKARAKRMECLNDIRQLNFALRMYADDNEDEYPPRAEREFSWIYTLEPYYNDAKVLRCPSDHASTNHSYILNGFNDWFEANLTPSDYALYKDWRWPRGMKSDGASQPSDTVTFGEKRKNSIHVHMDFFQGLGNDIDEIDHGKHNDGAARAGGANFGFMDGGVRFLKYWQSLTPENLWAVTPAYRQQAIPEP